MSQRNSHFFEKLLVLFFICRQKYSYIPLLLYFPYLILKFCQFHCLLNWVLLFTCMVMLYFRLPSTCFSSLQSLLVSLQVISHTTQYTLTSPMFLNYFQWKLKTLMRTHRPLKLPLSMSLASYSSKCSFILQWHALPWLHCWHMALHTVPLPHVLAAPQTILLLPLLLYHEYLCVILYLPATSLDNYW